MLLSGDFNIVSYKITEHYRQQFMLTHSINLECFNIEIHTR